MGSGSCENVIIRADADGRVGTGHVMRCLALAQAWQDAGGVAHFVAAALPSGLAERLAAEGMALHRLDVAPGSREDNVQTLALANDLGATWVVEDGYHFCSDYQRTIKDAGLRLLAIDDYGHAGHYVADLVLNQNIYADAALYPSREPTTQLLLGTQYVLLRREFRRWRGWQRQIPDVARKVLVTLGGGDPDNVTLRVIQALQQVNIDDLEVVAVVGPSNPHLQTLQSVVEASSIGIHLQQNVTDMSDLMAWSDVAIAAGGSTCWELAFMGVPAVLLILADNQIAVATGLNSAEAALNLGGYALLEASDISRPLEELLASPEKRRAMSHSGQELVDGNGATRVVSLLDRGGLVLQPIQPEDCRLIWEWANDPATRAWSFAQDPVPWEQHRVWFETKLTDPLTHLYVALDAGRVPAGQIRFQVEGEAATVSVSLAPEQRGKGYGAEIIRLGTQQIWATTEVTQIHAYIKLGNDASIRAFAKAGFVGAGIVEVQSCSALHFVIRRPYSNAGNVSD